MAHRTAIITGATGGMGAEIARRLASRYDLILVDIDQGALDELANTLPNFPQTVAGSVADQGAIDAIVEKLGSHELGAIVHAAGLSPTMADGRKILDVNLVGTARLTRALLPRCANGTVFVAIASMAGHSRDFSPLYPLLDRPLDGEAIDELLSTLSDAAAYPVSKAGVIRLVVREAKAWGERGGRIVSLSPGLISTKMGEAERKSSPIVQRTIDAQPVARMGVVAEIANAVEFLISGQASFITGTDLLVDGGSMAVQQTDPEIGRIMRGE